jgi:hypothetical protein
MTHDPTDNAGFEKWALREGLDLTRCPRDKLETDTGTPLPTYWINATEYAWRGWANRPHRTTYAEIVSTWPTPAQKAQPWRATDPDELRAKAGRLPSTFEPLPDDAYHGMPRFGEVLFRSVGMNSALAAPYGVEPPAGSPKGIQPVAWRYPKIPGHPHWDLRYWVDRKSEEHRDGEEELFAARPLIDAVRKLVAQLPTLPLSLAHFHARDDLLEVRRLLGDE